MPRLQIRSAHPQHGHPQAPNLSARLRRGKRLLSNLKSRQRPARSGPLLEALGVIVMRMAKLAATGNEPHSRHALAANLSRCMPSLEMAVCLHWCRCWAASPTAQRLPRSSARLAMALKPPLQMHEPARAVRLECSDNTPCQLRKAMSLECLKV